MSNSINNSQKNNIIDELIVECSKTGSCYRNDGVKLIPGYQIKKKISFYNLESSEYRFEFKSIISFNPFENSESLKHIKGSNTFICADGFGECINSCCNFGFCSNPKNICTQIHPIKNKIIYTPCIIFFIIILTYWIFYVIIGLKYSKKKSGINLNKNLNKSINNEKIKVNNQDINVNHLNDNDNMKILDNFQTELPLNANKKGSIYSKNNSSKNLFNDTTINNEQFSRRNTVLYMKNKRPLSNIALNNNLNKKIRNLNNLNNSVKLDNFSKTKLNNLLKINSLDYNLKENKNNIPINNNINTNN